MGAGRVVKSLELILERVLKSRFFTVRYRKRHRWRWGVMHLGVT